MKITSLVESKLKLNRRFKQYTGNMNDICLGDMDINFAHQENTDKKY